MRRDVPAAIGNETQDDLFCFGGVGGAKHFHSIRLEGGGRPLDAGVIRQASKPAGD